MQLKLLNYVSHSYDGAVWQLVDPTGKHPTVKYYSSNPVVYGVPEKTVQVGKTVFEVEELVQSAGDDLEAAGVVYAEL